MLIVGLLTPLSIGIGLGVDYSSDVVVSYLLFVVFAIAILLFREVIRRSLRAQGPDMRQYILYGTFEGVILLASIGGLVLLQGQVWWLALLALPGVVLDTIYRQEGSSFLLLDLTSGVVVLSLTVPLGLVLVDIGDPGTVLLVFGLFVAYHLLAILRVKAVMNRGNEGPQPFVGLESAIHALFLGLAVGGWWMDLVGIAAPMLFLVTTMRTVQLVWFGEPPTVKWLGQTEAMLSLCFVLGGPLLLP